MKFLSTLFLLLIAGIASASTPTAPTIPYNAGTNPCGMVLNTSAPIFCYPFTSPMGNPGTRTGDLDPNAWGVSRGIGEAFNSGQGFFDQWNETVFDECDGTTPIVVATADVQICNGQLREATNDNNTLVFDAGDVLTLAMYPKQPFDFTGRTGTLSFDISNDSTGTHAVWPEIWLSNLPVPMPFSHFDSWVAFPQYAIGIRLASVAPIGMAGQCPNNHNLSFIRWTIDSAIYVNNYNYDDTNGYGTLTGLQVTFNDCVISSAGPQSGPSQMNHVEMRFSANEIDVYATDAGVKATASTLRKIATISGMALPLTTGLVWLEDVHYNADKQTTLDTPPLSPTQRQHTFTWNNLAFDGPFTYRDFTYDAPDNTATGPNGSIQIGRYAPPAAYSSWSIAGLPANPALNTAASVVLFNFAYGNGGEPHPTSLNVIVNGNTPVVTPWPYPDNGVSPQGSTIGAWRTLAVPVPIANLVTGTNVVQIGANVEMAVANVDIALHSVTGGVPILPGSNNAYPQPTGTWTNVTPAGVDLTSTLCGNYGAQTVAADPYNPGSLYVEFNCQGIWKSTDYGQTWTGPINTGTNGTTVSSCGSGLSITPTSLGNKPIVYEGCIRGTAIGFWKSTDGGVNWTNHVITPTPSRQDYYPPVTDPYNQNHLLLNGHEQDSIVQSFDGGSTWSSVPLASGMLQTNATGYAFFINTGNPTTTATTWLWLGSQSGGTFGTWRTTNSGTTWTKVDNNEHPAGSCQIYQPSNSGLIYMAGQYSVLGNGILRSTDYGQTWTHVGGNLNEVAVIGTSKNIYAMYSFPGGPGVSYATDFQIGALPGTGTYTNPTTPAGMVTGSALLALANDGSHNILLGAMYNAGLWRYVEP